MATKIIFIKADTLDGLESAVNDFFDQHADDDTRTVTELVGGVSYANGVYVMPMRLYVSYKRRFDPSPKEDDGC